MESLISVIVPVYNTGNYLESCINSIINQTYKHLEIIIVNDGSIDDSLDICRILEKKDKRIRIINKQNGGLSSARNAGLNYANGELISFVDSDDYLRLDYYESLASTMKEYSLDIVSCYFIRITDPIDIKKTNITSSKHYKNSTILYEGKEIIEYYMDNATIGGAFQNDISCCTKLYKRDAIGNQRFIEGMIYEDVVFNALILSKINRYGILNYYGYYYYENEKSITKKTAYSTKVFDLIEGANIIRQQVENGDLKLKKILRNYEVKVHISVLNKLLKSYNVNKNVLIEEIIIVKKNFFINLQLPLPVKRKILLIIFQIIPTKLISAVWHKIN